MPYHSGMTRAQGDPGFFSFLGKVAGTIARAIPGPIGAIATAVLPGGRPAPPPVVPIQPIQQLPVTRVPGLPGAIERMLPGGRTGLEVTIDPVTGLMCPRKRRRRIDPLNMKALRRANTRQKAFLRAVDRTLKTMPTKGSVASRRKKISGAIK